MTIPPANPDAVLQAGNKSYRYYNLETPFAGHRESIARLPYSIRIMLEGLLRNCNGREVTVEDIQTLANWKPNENQRSPLQFFPGRVLLQDFTGVPVIVDLAAMRDAMKKMGGDPSRINPSIPVDLVIDHSVQVDYYGSKDAFQRNTDIEFQRNHERYELLHWAQKAFKNLRVVPPATGIVHQVNLEYLAALVMRRELSDGSTLIYPETLVGTDSHTTMINGLGVVGWGVGGIEAIAAMLNQPLEILTPDVIGFRLTGKAREGVTPTDITLTIVQMLRKKNVVEKFVEFCGEGLDGLSLYDRAMISNMSPENGATLTYFPVDEQTLAYLRGTSRSAEVISLVENYYRAQHLFREKDAREPVFTDLMELDLSTVEPSIAGPRRPQDRITLSQVKQSFEKSLTLGKKECGFSVKTEDEQRKVPVTLNGSKSELAHGAVVIASITSCTNTSNPVGMITAGLLAKNAVRLGLRVKPTVKTSLAPGSRVVTDYLEQAGLMNPLAELGFSLVGYGCMTCIGNSGPLPEEVSRAISANGLITAAVISGNRNFEGRVHPQTQANYLASPPLVVAYALAGTVDLDLTSEPLGTDNNGRPVFLRDIWPTTEEVQSVVERTITSEMYRSNYANVFSGSQRWNEIKSTPSELFSWQDSSTYVQNPPYFAGLTLERQPIQDLTGARALAVLGDSITTDHISPAGSIPSESPAGAFLLSNGVTEEDFNSFGSRRGNDRVMARGTFANIRLKNQLVPDKEGGYTVHLPDRQPMSIYAAAERYKADGVPTIILAGKEYGTGSSRDWAAKGPLLLGVRAVIAESFERIHRSNLVGMGILPLQFKNGDNARSLGLTGEETFFIEGIAEKLGIGAEMTVKAVKDGGQVVEFPVTARLNTEIEMDYYRNSGIMQTVIRNILAQ